MTMVSLWPVTSERAAADGRYLSFAAASRTRCLVVSGKGASSPLRIRLTVERETPASAATSELVAGLVSASVGLTCPFSQETIVVRVLVTLSSKHTRY